MGSMQAAEMAEMLPLEDSIRWHLRSNHYPPVPSSMVPVCIAAIEACNLENYGEMIDLPDGVSFRGATRAPANEIARAHHLDAWIGGNDD